MTNKNRNPHYDVLDKILQDSDSQGRGNGFAPFQDKNGQWITTKEQFDTLYSGVEDIEKYLRS